MAPAGEARQEWEVIEDLSKRIGVAPYSLPALRLLAKLGVRIKPRALIDILLRTGPRATCSAFAARGSRSKKVERSPHGIVLDDQIATGVLAKKVRHGDRRVHLDDPRDRLRDRAARVRQRATARSSRCG